MSTISVVSKGVLLFFGSTFFVFGLTPPNPPPKEKTLIYKGQLFERIFKVLICGGLASTLLAFCGNIVLLTDGPSQQYSHHSKIVSKICPHSSPSSFDNLTQISLPFLLGITALVLGSSIRLWCFHTLGKLFTYEVSIQPEHKLITSGPYGIVRHPSYTGLVVMLAGAAIACLSPGSYIQECGLMATSAKWFIGLWLSAAFFIALSLGRRGEVEDLALEESFGYVWRQYSERVSYRFIPYLI